MFEKKRGCGVLIILVSVFFIGSVFALNANFTFNSPSNSLVDRGSNVQFNLSVGALNGSIQRLTISYNCDNSYPAVRDFFIIDSNDTTALNATFLNQTSGAGTVTTTLIFTNTTTQGFIQNSTLKNFLFNLSTRTQNTASGLYITLNATGVDGSSTQTTINFDYSFRFSGFVKNESGEYQNATNVTLYKVTRVPMAPPIENLIANVLTNENGEFTFTGLNATNSPQFLLKMIYYNESRSATKVGASLPAMPSEMFMPPALAFGENQQAFAFMRPPTLNGSTFYLQSAATINISAQNGSTVNPRQLFGYMVLDQKTGIEVASNIMGNESSVQVVVPTGKTYTAMVVRVKPQFANYAVCTGSFMNDTACMSSPKSNSTINPTIAGGMINVNFDLTISKKNMYGCIGVAGNNTPITNITNILPRMLPWPGFVPPMNPDTKDINLANNLQLNYSDSRCNGSGNIAWYNLSLLNSNYFVEFFATNLTGANTGRNLGEWVGAFQNISLTSANVNQNITLNALAGRYTGTTKFGEVNVTKININIQNSSGGAISQDTPHVSLNIRHSTFGEVNYIVDELTNGSFSVAIPSNAVAKLKVFSNNAPPKEKTLNLSQDTTNITLVTMSDGRDAGFKKKNASGSLEPINISKDSGNVNMRFLKYNSVCNVIEPDDSLCSLESMASKDFNPLIALVAGNINMEMKLTESNVTIIFYNYDMFSAKQPPMESVMNSEATSGGSSADQVWEFGSFVPADVYDYAIISFPYLDSIIDDSGDINMTIPQLYDENWNVAWNKDNGDTTDNLTTNIDTYLGNSNGRSYNSTLYRSLLSFAGVICNKTDNSINETPCFINTTSNRIYLKIPHFSGVAPNIVGNAIVEESSPNTNIGGGGGSSSGGVVSEYYTVKSLTETEFKEKPFTRNVARKNKIVFKINNENHSVMINNITNNKVIIIVESTPQTAEIGVGEEKKFDVNSDGTYDLKIKINNMSTISASLTLSYINEKIASTTPTSKITDTKNPEQINDPEPAEKIPALIKNKPNDNTNLIIIIMMIVVIIVAIGITLIFKRKDRKDVINNTDEINPVKKRKKRFGLF